MNKGQNLKSYIKKNFRSAYDFAGAVKNGLKVARYRRETEARIVATHTNRVSVEYPLGLIAVNSSPKRLNLVFSSFSKKSLENKEIAAFLAAGIKIANDYDYTLRIISRNNQINPRDFMDFINNQGLAIPSSYSFYTDLASRLSSPVRRIDISPNDVIFSENELVKLKKWNKE